MRRPNVTIAPLPRSRAPARGHVIALSPGARLEVSAAQERRE